MTIAGALLGTTIGDALGLPYEGLSPRRAARLLGPPDRFRLIAGRGMISDDTEHACITVQAWIASGGDPDRFAADLSRRLRRWLLALPPGVGFATLRAILKNGGVWSAGNGPAMRAPVLGAAVSSIDELKDLVHRSTILTHRDPRAEWGALAAALAARHATSGVRQTILSVAPGGQTGLSVPQGTFLEEIETVLPPDQLLDRLRLAARHAQEGTSVEQFARTPGLERGVTGFIDETVPVAIYAWLRHPRDLRAAVESVIRCGGDTDSVAAIAGGIIGAGYEAAELPQELLARIIDWPRSVAWITSLGHQADGDPRTVADVSFGAAAPRNLSLLAVVLAHGFRRMLPPY